jgi:hypothetical protein
VRDCCADERSFVPILSTCTRVVLTIKKLGVVVVARDAAAAAAAESDDFVMLSLFIPGQ